MSRSIDPVETRSMKRGETIRRAPATRGRQPSVPRMRQRIYVTDGAGVPPSLAGVSHAVIVGGLCHTGGQLAIDARGRLIEGTVADQTRVAFKNLLSVLAEGGFSRRDIMFIDIALTDIRDLPEVNDVFRSVFTRSPRPARAVLEASRLPLGAKVRLHALAARGDATTYQRDLDPMGIIPGTTVMNSRSASNVFPRQIGSLPPVAVRGNGLYIIDAAGKRYLDASGGPAVSCLGHSDPDVIAAIKDQVDRIAFAHTSYFTSAAAEDLADLLIDQSPIGFGKVYFTGSGSEAIEAAIKMARQFFIQTNRPQKTKFIARHQSYYGATLGALPLSGVEWRRELYAPLTMQASFISPCNAYRFMAPGETEEAYGQRSAEALEAEILRLGPDNVAAFVAETIVGASAGVVPAVPGYFRHIRQICDRYDVLLILDEVMCGMGRTGATFACAQEGITPDLLCIAKSLGGGYQAIAAVLVSSRIHDAFAAHDRIFHHGQTYMGHPTACAAALAVQTKVRDLNLLPKVTEQGNHLLGELVARLGQHPHIGDVRGRGCLSASRSLRIAKRRNRLIRS